MVKEISKNFIFKLLLFVLFLLFSLIIIEKLIPNYIKGSGEIWRFSGIYQLDSELIYALKKNVNRLKKYNDGFDNFNEYVTTNSLGLRDSELKAKDKFIKRIVILGDSMTFGHSVNNYEAFPNQLGKVFSENSINVDVINAGVKGYGTDQLYKLFKKRLLNLNTDILVLVIYKNDKWDNIILPLYTIEKEELRDLDARKNWLYIMGTIEKNTPSIIRKTNIYKFFLSLLESRDLFFLLPDYDTEGLLEWSKQKVYLQIKDLKNLGTENNFELIVLAMPFKNGSADEYEWLYRLPELGVNFIDPSKNEIWRERRSELFFRKDYHLTRKGSRQLAEMFYEYLKDFEQGSIN